ncbi:MAG: AsmA-like C-terminal domain-containing protein, partial [Proteobacteria bacterium]|nr:AsmA-like C-terminal domain-containing protein [Pseudomonadota bacterium]
TAQGSTFNLADNLAGKISIIARKGRIYRSNLLTKILSFLSIRNLVTGGTTDIAKKGFAYRSINVKGEIKGKTFVINEGILDSSTLSMAWQGSVDMATKKINITVLATPFQLSDLLLMGIPVVGIVFSRTLIGIPLRVTGTIDDPKLGPASPLAIGKGLLGVVTNIVKLPVKIIEPVLPER